jgi:hypothetical protein
MQKAFSKTGDHPNGKNETQYFLLQVSDFGSEQILDGYYEHWDWSENKRDEAHGDVRPGDLLLVYFTSKSLIHQKQVKMIYKVKSVTKKIDAST